MPTLTFWYDFASTYSFLAAEAVDDAAAVAGVEVTWRPFLLGPIFAGQGYTTSPFNLYPAKGRHMWRDLARLAARLGYPAIVRPDPFPANGLLAARVATALADTDRPAFSRAVFRAEFVGGADIADRSVMARLLTALCHDAEAVLARAASDEVKASLRAATAAAEQRGIFGAPSFTAADGELFWGSDRLADALAFAQGQRWGLPA
ncbi:2-hydroxychromene-2-carboxylate isomerase [Blastochloris viridis]|uniref:2-hydroxychromene-2-carboxylate isomerase n=1 Tax=Blastochloris viridis TaxID=1079 RepID=A0A0H5BD53_BLAVI|nr:2-hydroxychromene-2-carboxylate isomerase [Blastochloris viridis]ALK10971.1 2-hydroxychromene-2-carboxylate isomerase [Blastochloris viridis]BAR99044.1 2-hydroxychromene-2-carboxylate isomerase [Blastochloris viridis]CUU43633.1 DSBA-like thioredoxin domain protein [Blastochloris viridis]